MAFLFLLIVAVYLSFRYI